MKRQPSKWAILTVGTLASVTCATHSPAQSVDSLLDKLVDKGVLTTKEAKDLREESDLDFRKAYQAKSGMPDWVTSLKFNGDVRARFEGFYADKPAFVDRNRFRYRLRFGAVATLKDNFEVGLRLTSSEASGSFGGDPISGNTTFQDNGSKKFVFIDLAYGKWTAVNNKFMTAVTTVGKMENPFVLSDMVFDHDYTPEGLAQQFTFNVHDNHALKLNLGGFALDEAGSSSQDTYLLGAQLRLDSKWTKQFTTSVGVAGLAISGKQGLNTLIPSGSTTAATTVPNQNAGNTRSAQPAGAGPMAGANLLNNFNPVVVDASATYTLDSFPGYTGAFPIKLAGDYMNNPGAAANNEAYSVGLTLGKAGKKRLWEVGYRWKELQGDAWYEEFTESDFGSFYGAASSRTVGSTAPGYIAGTNVRGHILKGSYSPSDSFVFAITYYLTETIQESPARSPSKIGRLQVDATWKF